MMIIAIIMANTSLLITASPVVVWVHSFVCSVVSQRPQPHE